MDSKKETAHRESVLVFYCVFHVIHSPFMSYVVSSKK